LGVALLPAKVVTEALLYLVSFQVQRRFVFAREASAARVTPAPARQNSRVGAAPVPLASRHADRTHARAGGRPDPGR
jgi:hypothetical protein